MDIISQTGFKDIESITIKARVIRSNGDIEDLGTISHWKRPNILQRIRVFFYRLKKEIKLELQEGK